MLRETMLLETLLRC